MITGHVIDFTPDGQAHAMHNDKFSLGMLGDQKIERASEIKFNQDDQCWVICLPIPSGWLSYGSFTDGFKTYEGARQVEVAWLNSCRLEGADPGSEAGLEILRQLRGDMKL